MKRKGFLKTLIFHLVFIAVLVYPKINLGQTLKRQCISSYGSSASIGGAFISQTAGQSYSTRENGGGKSGVSQGFQQSGSFTLQKLNPAEDLELQLQVYPNPATHSFLIEGKETMEGYQIQVLNVEGKSIMTEKLGDVIRYEMNCESWDNGIYIIRLSDPQEHKQTLKLVISK